MVKSLKCMLARVGVPLKKVRALNNIYVGGKTNFPC